MDTPVRSILMRRRNTNARLLEISRLDHSCLSADLPLIHHGCSIHVNDEHTPLADPMSVQ